MVFTFSEIDAQSPFSEGWEAPTAAYVHIPFCRRRCFYCDFPVSVVGDRLRGETSLGIAQYVSWLCQEIESTPPQGSLLKTIFFGGGTPSLLSVEQVHQIIGTLTQHFGLAESPEISMEMDPGTFTLEQAQGYRQAGVNRVSLGSQAFQDNLLSDCGRTHRVKDIYEAVNVLRQAGYKNLSLDLISGLPNQTLGQWEASLERAIALSPQHISAYDLVIEPGTVFGKRFEPGEGPLPTDDLTAQGIPITKSLTMPRLGLSVAIIRSTGAMALTMALGWGQRAMYRDSALAVPAVEIPIGSGLMDIWPKGESLRKQCFQLKITCLRRLWWG
jgi:putative oxygen-independent coproporphyrinogen III oxidase